MHIEKVWDITSGTMQATHQISLVRFVDNDVELTSTGTDPYIILKSFQRKPDTLYYFYAEGEAEDTNWELFYLTANDLAYSEQKKISFSCVNPEASDGSLLQLSDSVTGKRLRIDFGHSQGAIRIHALKILAIPKAILSCEHIHELAKLDDNSWLTLLQASYNSRHIGKLTFPLFPERKIQVGMIGSYGEHALREVASFYAEVKAAIPPLAKDAKILDFGCGYGRITRFFLKDVLPENLYGTDTTAAFIDICKHEFSGMDFPLENFSVNDPFPRLNFPNNYFSLITAYSVFTHLSEEAVIAWLLEFQRILAPSGYLIVTLRQKKYLEYVAELARREVTSNYQKQEIAAFGNLPEMLARYEKGEFNHSPTGGGKLLDKSFYGDSVIPEGYVRNVFARYFTVAGMYDDGRCSQALCVLKKE